MNDLIIIGGGPGGYVAAERAAARGLKVLLAEHRQLGGVCLNEGCIPSKTLLYSAKLYHYACHGAAYGVTAEGVRFDFAAARARKAQVTDTLRKGVAGLMKKHKVEVVNGRAILKDRRTVSINGQAYEAKNILIATGSAPARPPIPGLDLPGVVDSTGLLNLERDQLLSGLAATLEDVRRMGLRLEDAIAEQATLSDMPTRSPMAAPDVAVVVWDTPITGSGHALAHEPD